MPTDRRTFLIGFSTILASFFVAPSIGYTPEEKSDETLADYDVRIERNENVLLLLEERMSQAKKFLQQVQGNIDDATNKGNWKNEKSRLLQIIEDEGTEENPGLPRRIRNLQSIIENLQLKKQEYLDKNKSK